MRVKQSRVMVRLASGGETATKPGPARSLPSNYSADAGQGSSVFEGALESAWRRLLLGSVAAGAMWTAVPRQAQALSGPPVNCTSGPADVLNCSGDLSQGVVVSPSPYTTVNVGKVTTDIAPPAPSPGILVDGTGSSYSISGVTLNSDLGSHQILTTANGAAGIAVNAPLGVTIVHRGNVTTSGDYSPGIVAYSDRDISITSTSNVVTSGLGAPGIVGVTGFGDVTIASTGNITVAGTGSGILAMTNSSKGVRSSYSAAKAAVAGNIVITSTGNITAGSAGSPASPGFGGVGMEAGIAAFATGSVSITSTGDITAFGDGRGGITAYSAGYYCCVRTKLAPEAAAMPAPYALGGINIVSRGNITTSGDQASAVTGLAIGGDVTITSTGDLKTSGSDSHGIRAQSYTGHVGVTSKGDITTAGVDASAILGVSAFRGVSIVSTGNIRTTGYGAYGIEAVGHEVDRSDTSAVEVKSKGNITTRGFSADAIVAVNYSGGINIRSNGDIAAKGFDAFGIRAINYSQSAIGITIEGGTVSGGTGDYAASVAFFGGGTNTLTNRGTITGGGSGWAVVGKEGAETVLNYGTISGDVDLADEPAAPPLLPGKLADINTFINASGGLFNAGSFVDVGTQGTLDNEGTINPGGAGRIERTELIGKLVQRGTGRLEVDVDHGAGRADRIDATGTATLSGKVVPNLTNIDVADTKKAFTILTADGGVTDSGLTVTDTAVIDYELLYPAAETVRLGVALDFTPDGLNQNQNAVAGYIARSIGNGAPAGFDDMLAALLGAPDVETYAAYLDQLYSNALGGIASGALGSGEALALALRSCSVPDGEYAQQRETSCLWAKPSVRRFDQGRSGGMADVVDVTSGITGGFQTALGTNLWGGLAVSVENSDTLVDGKQKLDGTWVQGGGVIKWVDGPWKISGSLTFGHAGIDSERDITIPGLALTAVSDSDLDFGTGLARFAYSFGSGGFYVTPMIDAGVNYLRFDGFKEHGAGALDLDVQSTDAWVLAATPAVEIGATIVSGNQTFRPYVRAGVMFLSEDSISARATLAGAPAGTDPFTIRSEFADVLAEFGAGITMFSDDGLTLRLNYEGKAGEETNIHGLDAKLTVKY